MAGKPGKPINLRQTDSSFSWDEFISNVSAGHYVLVIGPEVILDKAVDNQSLTNPYPSDGNINKYIIKAIGELAHKEFHSFTDIAVHYPPELDPVKTYLKDGFDFVLDDIEPRLKELIATKKFRIVITTTIDNYLEVLMRKVWGEDLRVVNLYNETEVSEFNQEYKQKGGSYNQPTLFHIFGKALSPYKYVKSDKSSLEAIERLMNNNFRKDPFSLLIHREGTRFLSLGCKYDDWQFRILWFILTGSIGNYGMGQVALSLDEHSETDCKLKSFLQWLGIFDHGDAREFIDEILKRLTEISIKKVAAEGLMGEDVFISYKHADFDTALMLFYRLKENGFKVWMDTQAIPGENYNEEIPRKINQAKVFIALLTPSVAKDLMNKNDSGRVADEHYYMLEWKQAVQSERRIIPLAANGYNLSISDAHPEHKEFENFFKNGDNAPLTINAIDWGTPSGFSNLVNTITKTLKDEI